MRKMVAFLIVWVAIVPACFHFRTIRTDIAPAIKPTEKYATRIAACFSPQLEILTKVAKPDTAVGARHTYNYILGPALQEALTRSVRAVYPEAAVFKVLPRRNEFDRILSFDLETSKVTVEFVPGYLNQQAKATSELSVILEIIEGASLKTIKRLRIQGAGQSSRDASGFNAYAAKHFTLAMEEAIRQVADLVTRLLSEGAAEGKLPSR